MKEQIWTGGVENRLRMKERHLLEALQGMLDDAEKITFSSVAKRAGVRRADVSRVNTEYPEARRAIIDAKRPSKGAAGGSTVERLERQLVEAQKRIRELEHYVSVIAEERDGARSALAASIVARAEVSLSSVPQEQFDLEQRQRKRAEQQLASRVAQDSF